MIRLLAFALTFFTAITTFAATAARDSYIPVAGRTRGAGGRSFDTTLWLTNVSDAPASVTLSFLRAAQPNPTPFTYTQRLGPSEIRRIVLPDYLLGTAGVGALRVRSSEDVLATAHVLSMAAGDSEARAVGASIDAVPAEHAIGSNEVTMVHGLATPGARYKLYAVETSAHPLYFTVTLIDGRGQPHGQKRYFIDARESRAFDVQAEFPNAPPSAVALRIRGVNGSGKIIACGISVATESQDSTTFAMSVPRTPRHRMPGAEIAAYVIGAVALALAVFRALRPV